MDTLTISLSPDRLNRLREIAERLQIEPEDLARVGIDELLSQPDDAFEAAVARTLAKNAELYRRLA